MSFPLEPTATWPGDVPESALGEGPVAQAQSTGKGQCHGVLEEV